MALFVTLRDSASIERLLIHETRRAARVGGSTRD